MGACGAHSGAGCDKVKLCCPACSPSKALPLLSGVFGVCEKVKVCCPAANPAILLDLRFGVGEDLAAFGCLSGVACALLLAFPFALGAAFGMRAGLLFPLAFAVPAIAEGALGTCEP